MIKTRYIDENDINPTKLSCNYTLLVINLSSTVHSWRVKLTKDSKIAICTDLIKVQRPSSLETEQFSWVKCSLSRVWMLWVALLHFHRLPPSGCLSPRERSTTVWFVGLKAVWSAVDRPELRFAGKCPSSREEQCLRCS